ncbi:MAG: DUF72 domain-containing protein, partial [Candidatus Hodarchaeales archaeon]
MIFLGTAGWKYNHWRGSFYSRHQSNDLEYYSRHSSLVEINSTFYRIPSEAMVRGWYHFTPDDFIFSAKLVRDITHSRDLMFNPETVKDFFDRMNQGLEDKFKTVLVQFPPALKYSEKSFMYLSSIIDECLAHFEGNIITEIRDESWINPDFEKFLVSNQISLARTTKFPIPEDFAPLTSLYYLRLLGDRKLIPDNSLGKVFLDKNEALREWVSKLVNLSSKFETIFVLINNRFSGYAINDAITL